MDTLIGVLVFTGLFGVVYVIWDRLGDWVEKQRQRKELEELNRTTPLDIPRQRDADGA